VPQRRHVRRVQGWPVAATVRRSPDHFPLDGRWAASTPQRAQVGLRVISSRERGARQGANRDAPQRWWASASR